MLGRQLIVVSDAHLGAAPPAVEEALLRFLEQAPDLGDSLLINGDLFDFWFSYRRVIPRHGFRVAAALARLRSRVPIVLVGGNHDRWDAGFWEHDLGITFAARSEGFQVGDRRVLAVHGDGVSDQRLGSRILNALVGHRAVVALYRALHPDFSYRLVDRMAPHLGERPPSPAEVEAAARRQEAWATARLDADRELDLIIMGHTHRPGLRLLPDGRGYLNPGAWFDGCRFALVTPTDIILRQFTG